MRTSTTLIEQRYVAIPVHWRKLHNLTFQRLTNQTITLVGTQPPQRKLRREGINEGEGYK